MGARTCRWVSVLLFAALAAAASAMDIRDIEQFLANEGEPLPFHGAANRIAMATYEDPEGTALGDAAAFLVSNRVLFDAQAGGLGVILFEQGLSPDASGLGYFEKLDRLTADGDFHAAVWGHIDRDGDEIVVDTFAQLYPEKIRRMFHQQVQMGDLGPLYMSVAPRRIHVQSLRFPASGAQSFRAVADSVRTLRRGPERAAGRVPQGRLAAGSRYRISDRQGAWTYVALGSGELGWTSVEAWAEEDPVSAALMAAADFVNGLLRYANSVQGEIPVHSTYARPAAAVIEQIQLMEALRGSGAPGAGLR
ncbi:MAG TPA: hypothetical protein VKU85_01900, partial [bacterium]|nr:hypothetical protein [bacterium]